MNNCKQCGKEITGRYARLFCDRSCAGTFNGLKRRHTAESKEKIKKTLNKIHHNNELFNYNCEKCGCIFEHKRIKRGRKIHCNNCKRKVGALKATKLSDLSKRTITKLLKRANFSCVMCNWDKTSLDLHHIIPRSQDGSDENDNLVALCPNCHRMAHEKQYSLQELQEKSIEKTLDNWRDFYYSKYT